MSIFSLLGCLELKLHILTLFRVKVWEGEGPNFFLQISFSWVKMSFHIEFYPTGLPRTGQKVCGGGGGWVVVVVVLRPILVFSLGQAEQKIMETFGLR